MATRVLEREDVEVIFSRLNNGERGTAIARDFAVSQQTISAIKRGDTWGHVTGLREARHPRSRISRAKLTEAEVLDINGRLNRGVKPRVLADEYGVSNAAIYAIKYGETWNWLTGNGKES